MAENSENIQDDLAEKNTRNQVYEQLWIIPNWKSVRKNVHRLTAKTFEFKTGKSVQVQTKWEVGFMMHKPGTHYRFYWKLIEQKGFSGGKVQATAECALVKDNSVFWRTGTEKTTVSLGQVVLTPIGIMLNSDYWRGNIDKGKGTFKLKLIITEPDLNMKRFHECSIANVDLTFARLLGDETTADLKILTSDGIQLLAHKNVLQAQCPVFEAMFRSDFSENITGIVNVKDVSAKTMGIFLHLFYTGELLPSWKDQDIVVEFTYAVSKYQLTNVLELLDNLLGSRDEEEASHADVQLLDWAQKLDLRIAEKELMVRIKKSVNKMNSGAEFFAFCGFDKN